MAPTPKRQKTSNDESTPPAGVISMSPEQQQQRQQGEAHPVQAPTEQQLNIMLKKLRTSKKITEADESIRALYKEMKANTQGEIAAEKVARLEGVATILVALNNWYLKSLEFSKFSIFSFVLLTTFVQKTRQTILRIGGIKTILATASIHNTNNHVRANVVGLFNNILMIEDNEAKEEVATEECISVVIKTMKRWPNDTDIQEAGCRYFQNISMLDGTKRKLHEIKICSFLGKIVDNFIDSDDDVYQCAKRALEVYMVK